MRYHQIEIFYHQITIRNSKLLKLYNIISEDKFTTWKSNATSMMNRMIITIFQLCEFLNEDRRNQRFRYFPIGKSVEAVLIGQHSVPSISASSTRCWLSTNHWPDQLDSHRSEFAFICNENVFLWCTVGTGRECAFTVRNATSNEIASVMWILKLLSSFRTPRANWLTGFLKYNISCKNSIFYSQIISKQIPRNRSEEIFKVI